MPKTSTKGIQDLEQLGGKIDILWAFTQDSFMIILQKYISTKHKSTEKMRQ